MNASRANPSKVAAPYVRPALARTAPLRGAGQLYRQGGGVALGGVPLTSAEDAVVAAVRMGYRVAQSQIERAGHIGERLRQAGERAVGPDPGDQAIDATERLVGKSLMTALQWLEGVAAEPGSPLRRYATAQYKLLGALLGLKADADAEALAPSPAAPTPAAAAASQPQARSDAERAAVRRGAGAGMRIVHRTAARRAVRVLRLHLDRPIDDVTYPLLFHGPRHDTAASIKADLEAAGGQTPVLRIDTDAASPAGVWTAAVCSLDGEQLGWIEIEQL